MWRLEDMSRPVLGTAEGAKEAGRRAEAAQTGCRDGKAIL
jgi:hypothetical protein